MSFLVRFTKAAEQDLEQLFDFILERELAREEGDFDLAEMAIPAIVSSLQVLERSPFTCRKATGSPFLRELIIPFGATGYVALFEIEDGSNVAVIAVRHQREDDYH
jgi:plasmid stabilization system protein ParE